jgi:hypothetical protein
MPLPSVLTPPGQTRSERLLVALLVLAGLAARCVLLFDGPGGTLAKAHPIEDGYLMLTIARNIALGHGMTIADGTIATNGTQPGMTFVYALGFWLFGGDKWLGIKWAMGVDIALAVASLLLWAGIARRLLGASRRGERLAAVAAAFWFAAPKVADHSLNCLETSGYGVCVLLVVRALLGFDAGGPGRRLYRALALGALLGVAFWVRNDAAFLVAGACLGLLCVQPGTTPAQRLATAFLAGGTSLVLALPWLVHNIVAYGHIMPVSGRLESLGARLGGNAGEVVTCMAEYLLFVTPLPQGLQQHWAFVALATIAVLAMLAFAGRLLDRADAAVRRTGLAVAVFFAGLAVFYGLFFGVDFFVSRYLYPLSPFLVLGSVGVMVRLAGHLLPQDPARLLRFAAPAAFLVVLGMLVRLCVRGFWSQHQQVVEWVRANVPAETWIGAIQTGTLGYYHDRTVNLDGKVNPEALKAAFDGRTQQYAFDKGLEYLCDQHLMAIEWRDLPVMRDHYELVVDDPDRGYLGLAVFRRKRP